LNDLVNDGWLTKNEIGSYQLINWKDISFHSCPR